MNNVLIWDLPTRLFHWLLAAGFITSAIISLIMGEDSPLFPYHAIIGLSLTLMILLRIVWGIIGTRYARFGSFLFGPAAVVEYLKGVLTGTGKRHIGHNPASAYAIFAMLLMLLGLAVTGFMMGKGTESVKEIHEILAYAMVVLAVAHVLGVALHILRHRENITLAMIHGRKAGEATDAIGSPHGIVAIAFILITGAWTLGVIRNFNTTTQSTTLPLLGIELRLGETEDEGGGMKDGGREGAAKDDDD